MTRCRCTDDYVCTHCEGRITDRELAQDGDDFDPSGCMADQAADRYQNWLQGDDR